MRDQTNNRYHRRIAVVLEYIANNLDAELSIQQLADVAHVSPWHFHRVFRALTGTPLGEAIRAIRLEFCAHELRMTTATISALALDCGYESGEALSRAFRRSFGVSPSVYRRLPTHTGVRPLTPRIVFNYHDRSIHLIKTPEEKSMDIRIEKRAATDYIYIENVGPYQNLGAKFGELVSWCAQRDLNLNEAEFFSHSFDSPRKTPASDLRSEACVAFQPNPAVDGKVKLGRRGGQRYAIHRFQGHYDGIQDAYLKMLEDFFRNSNEEIADSPFVERYVNDCNELPPEEWLTELCIPLRD